jgi:restriction endonuclease S subunit
MTKIDTTDWQDFNLSDLFEIKGSRTTSKTVLQEYGKGDKPFVTTQATSNGTEGFYNFATEKGGVLTVDSAVLGFCTYQDIDFSASDHVEKLIPRFRMTKGIALFLVTVMNRECYRYNYGRKASQERLKSQSIKLPARNNAPDWVYMEKFVDSRTPDYHYAAKPASNLKTPRLASNNWQFYKLSDLFEIETGKDLLYYSSLTGDNPVIGHSAVNNGVVAYTGRLQR